VWLWGFKIPVNFLSPTPRKSPPTVTSISH
jgi:hypothetical protein